MTAGPAVREGRDGDDVRRRRRLLTLAMLAVVPWTVLRYPGGLNLIFLWGSVTTAPPVLLTLPEYLAVVGPAIHRLPPRLLAWPVSATFLGLAVVTELVGERLGRAQPRLVAGLVVLAALVHLRVTLGLDRGGVGPSVPVGPLLAFPAAWWAYGSSFVPNPDRGER